MRKYDLDQCFYKFFIKSFKKVNTTYDHLSLQTFFLCSMNREFIDASGYYRVFCEDLLAHKPNVLLFINNMHARISAC